ncbi:MAG: pyridoxamine 5'-phosphate oxidase [Actinomycetota bacterium]|nr:pyridoxamine 5'-phosphate oxidase [Actinomycetota bacterium]
MTNPPPRDIAAWRREYEDRGLGEGDLGTDPIVAFRGWLDAADLAGLHEPNAMVVSTVGPDGPSSRIVLLKGLDARGFVFFTNYRSRKSAELDADAACALLFPWHPLERQVRVEGIASRTSADESDDYFASRPRPAQLGAWSSPQSEVVESRDYLEQRFLHERDRFADRAQIPRPEHWGGIRVRPHRVEFWQGRPGRLHDRVRFDRVDDSRWAIERLAP